MGTINYRTEPLEFWDTEEVSDGGLGTVSTPKFLGKVLAKWTILKTSREVEANMARIPKVYRFEFYASATLGLHPAVTVKFRGISMTIQNLDYKDDSRRKLVVTAMEQVTQANG